jgi:hypothetical protein
VLIWPIRDHLWRKEVERNIQNHLTWFEQLWKLLRLGNPAFDGLGPQTPLPPFSGSEPAWLLCQANASIAQGASGTVTVFSGSPLGSEQASLTTKTAYSRFIAVNSGDWLWIRGDDTNGWEIMVPSGTGNLVLEGYLTTSLPAPGLAGQSTTGTLGVMTAPTFTQQYTVTVTNRDTTLSLVSGKYVQVVRINGEFRPQWAAC